MMAEEGHASRLEAAARWYAELQAPDAGAGTWAAFLVWERDAANAAAFRQIEAALNTLDRTSIGTPLAAPVRRKISSQLWAGGLAAVVCLVALGAVTLLNVYRSEAPVAAPVVYATDVGEQRVVQLSDGSSVQLNTSSRIEILFSRDERRVELAQGQALFDVERAETPFVVYASASQTRALGTAFEVYARPGGATVTLLEGSVSVMPGGAAAAVRLEPGERLTVTDGTAQPVQEVDLSAALSWRSGVLQFKDTRLDEAIAELNRYSEMEIVLGDPDLAGETLSGSFRAGDQDTFVSALSLFLPVRAERSGDVITIVSAGD